MSEHHDDKLVEDYVGFLTGIIDEKGIHPHGWARRVADDKLEVFFLAVSPEESAKYFWQIVGMASPGDVRQDVLWGWDMTTLPGQGTVFNDAYVFVHWTRIAGEPLATQRAFRVGVINYQHEPRIVREVDWDNEHWTNWVMGYLAQNHPAFLMNFTLKGESAREGSSGE